MKTLFSIKEFLITRPKTVDVNIADKIYWYHIIPMIPVREILNVWMTASDFSGWRPKWWELKKGRSGNSQHVYKNKGAVDWTCENFKKNRDKFLELILEHTEYTRIAIYDTFIHCDYKPTSTGKREIFEYGYDKEKDEWKWLFLRHAA